jgi:hypothetical protein
MIGPFPLKLPIVDIHTIGAGGGSIAAVTSAGRLTVGPRSAGAEPGPVCYRRGGSEPTVTDAHLVLGRIPAAVLGGELPLDVPAAREPSAHRPLVSGGGGGRRRRRDRGQHDGPRHPDRVGGARPRPAALRPGGFRRRRPASRLPPGRAARHPDRDHPAAAGRALDLGSARHRRPLDLRAHRGTRAPAAAAEPSSPRRLGRSHRQAQAWLGASRSRPAPAR